MSNKQVIHAVLNLANQHPDAIWRFWHYDLSDKKLVLRGCRFQSNPTGNLVFYNPLYMKLADYLKTVYFAEATSKEIEALPCRFDPNTHQAISMCSEGKKYWIVCESIEFVPEES